MTKHHNSHFVKFFKFGKYGLDLKILELSSTKYGWFEAIKLIIFAHDRNTEKSAGLCSLSFFTLIRSLEISGFASSKIMYPKIWFDHWKITFAKLNSDMFLKKIAAGNRKSSPDL